MSSLPSVFIVGGPNVGGEGMLERGSKENRNRSRPRSDRVELSMSWRFRKTFKVLPGVKLNLTPNGLSATLGASPFTVNVGPRGAFGNVSNPGTGIWTRQRLDSPSHAEQRVPGVRGAVQPAVPPSPLTPAAPHLPQSSSTEIRSASTELLN